MGKSFSALSSDHVANGLLCPPGSLGASDNQAKPYLGRPTLEGIAIIFINRYKLIPGAKSSK